MTTKVLSNDFMQRSLDAEAWKDISRDLNWTDELIEKYQDKIDWKEFSANHRIYWTIPMLQKYKANIDWDAISDCIIDDSLTDNILEAFKDKLNWSKLSDSRYITSELLDKYADKWDWEVIINNWNGNYYHGSNLWSKSTAIEFYERYKEYIPGEKLQDSMLWRCMIYERKKQLFTEITA